MVEQKLEHIEDMLSQLISTVGKIREEQTEMKNEMALLKDEQALTKNEMALMKNEQALMKEQIYSIRDAQNSMREENDKRHQEIMDRFSALEADQDHIWKKAVTNGREYAKFKIQYGI
ncbi:hypothetical protein [Virgibacillus necropolis]|uniref:Uncharacterized protein n=1 Tax=Virgibacillus necropolis TaxID=163877 RepID=A0A221MAJ9_9BACI|nr:hypothetical protein [Virgibacillus necropolis]ASN04659.1 hypothetical protein CFK40_06325 [Virgibacillus necropolis]